MKLKALDRAVQLRVLILREPGWRELAMFFFPVETINV